MALSSNSCQTAWIIFFFGLLIVIFIIIWKDLFSPIIFWIFKFPPPHDCRKSVHSACTASRALPVSIGTFYFVHSCQYLPCCRPRNYSLPWLGGILQWSVTGKGWFFFPLCEELKMLFPLPSSFLSDAQYTTTIFLLPSRGHNWKWASTGISWWVFWNFYFSKGNVSSILFCAS